ncbi:UNVERIFIED_CONTAM: hypothetical protein FKN15_065612 [Acipenser sinensis]
MQSRHLKQVKDISDLKSQMAQVLEHLDRQQAIDPLQTSASFDPPALSGVPGFSGGGQILLVPPGLGTQCIQERGLTGLLGRCRGDGASTIFAGGLHHRGLGSQKPTSKKAYAAEAQVTRLANTGGLLTAYLDGMLRSVSLPEPLASELFLVSGALLQISGF